MSPAGTQGSQRRGVWEPLPAILYGYAIHPLSTSQRRESLHDSKANGDSRTLNGVKDQEESASHEMIVALDVGDDVYAFERYVPKGKEADGIWYRGYVVCTSRRSDTNLQCNPGPCPEQQEVYIGIFPASHIHVREEFSDEEGRLQDVTSASPNRFEFPHVHRSGAAMSTLLEETEEEIEAAMSRRSHRLGPPPGLASVTGGRGPISSTRATPSLRSVSPSESQNALKPIPPRPALKSGDETISGSYQPIIDEIASALREWYGLIFTYLKQRDYKLFHTVCDHIEALHRGRRQLLAQTLSKEETMNLRRDCVARLVAGNIIQGLDVIVRHPAWGGLVTVDVEGEADTRSWVSGVRMYAMQSSLAYVETTSTTGITRNPAVGLPLEYASKPLPTPAQSAFPEYGRPRARPTGSLGPSPPTKTAVRFYHVFLDLRAFVASLCSPGETVELYFSLYNKADARFLSEDFCAVLNHNGVSAREPADGRIGRLSTLFTDLAQTDVQESIYLVCRIVRNGSMKMPTMLSSSGQQADGRRASETTVREGATPTWSEASTLVPMSPQRQQGNPFEVQCFRRPFGCAVLELSQLNQLYAEQADVSSTKEHSMQIFVPVTEAAFSTLHQDIIASKVREFTKSPRAEMMAVSIKVFRGHAATIVKENPSLLHEVPLTSPLGFPDVVFPGDVRNEVYIKLWSGEFFTGTGGRSYRRSMNLLPGTATGPFNVQVVVEVRNSSGVVERVISPGSGEPTVTQFRSMVFHRNNSPTYGELIKLLLPTDVPPKYHLFFTFRHRTSKEKLVSNRASMDGADRPFAFAYLPLFPDSRAFVQDGSHCLVLYRADKLLNIISPSDYYGAPAILPVGQRPDALTIPVHIQRTAVPMRDSLVIRSYLCSTKYTQNSVLLGLLHWEDLTSHDELLTVLSKFTFVGEVEIVKFLGDIFNSLFAILISPSNSINQLDDLVFNALVAVLGIVQDHRFSNFQPVLDVYIEKHFSCPTAYLHILHSMNRLIADPTSSTNAQPLRSALKVWHYLFKFITRSRELQKIRESGLGKGTFAETIEATFKREVSIHLADVNEMMASPSPSAIIGTQTIALQNFTYILPDLAEVFTTVELVTIVSDFANVIQSVKGKIVIWKLIMYLQIVKGFLFDLPQSRTLLVDAVVLWIKPHFGRFDEFSQTDELESTRHNARIDWLQGIRLCVTIISIMLDKLQSSLIDPSIQADSKLFRQEQEHVECLLSLMPRILDSYLELQSIAFWKAIEHVRSPATLAIGVPVAFPESYPFSLVASLPPVAKPSQSPDVPNDQPTLFNCTLAETAVVFLTLVLSSPRSHLSNFLETTLDIQGKDNFVFLLSKFFKMATSILNNEAWPKNWLNLDVLAHKVLLKIVDPIAELLIRDFVPEHESSFEFNANLWREAFYMLLKLLSSDQLVIEDFSPQKRRAVWRLSGEIRGEGAVILLKLWEALGWPEAISADAGSLIRYGGYQVSLHALVGHVVNLCLSKHDLLRAHSTQILYSMIVSEHHLSGQFDDIENEVVTKLDSLFMSDSKGDDISRAFFIGQLRHLFDNSPVDDALRQRVARFLESVDLFLELLLNVRALPEGEEFQDDRVIATLRLMNFIRRIGRDEIYIKYVHQLVNMHLQSQNYVEAALTLKLHSDLHEWDVNIYVDPMEDLGLPRQTAFARKETLSLLILDYLGKGKAWESAVDICKELAFQHSDVTFNYGRLAEVLIHQATLLEHIVTDQRHYPDYFMVAFFGNFPDALRGKQYIYRGYEWERYSAFCERMLNKHSEAQLQRTMSDQMDDPLTQYIVIVPVEPEPDRESAIFTNPDVPLAVRKFYEHSGVNVFSSSNPIVRTIGEDGEEEIWIGKTYYTTEELFPTVMRRSEVVDTASIEISPLEHAFNEVEERTRKVAALERRYATMLKTGQAISTNALSMSLNAVVDAPMEEGVPHYRHVFFTPGYTERHPERAELVHKLREAIDEQARVLDSCLKLHGQICPQEMLPFHETLERLFQKNFSEEILRLPLDPISEPRQNLDMIGRLSSGISNSSGPISQQHLLHQQSVSSFPERTLTSPSLPGSKTLPGTSISPTPYGHIGVVDMSGRRNQTPLQKHLAYLARYGMTGVSSGPNDRPNVGGSDEHSVNSLRESSLVNGAAAGNSGVSIAQSGSGSLRNTLKKFSILNLGRTSKET
ncbi:cytoplasmic protein [Hysterangium stoloniferum]|nr:cytoplasmic protein [Hysterangium stoloniferum]